MRKLTTATALLMLLSTAVAVAQNTRTDGTANSGTNAANSGGQGAAPIGHRQPRAGDVPSEKGVTKLDAEDAALDRKIKSICRGC